MTSDIWHPSLFRDGDHVRERQPLSNSRRQNGEAEERAAAGDGSSCAVPSSGALPARRCLERSVYGRGNPAKSLEKRWRNLAGPGDEDMSADVSRAHSLILTA